MNVKDVHNYAVYHCTSYCPCLVENQKPASYTIDGFHVAKSGIYTCVKVHISITAMQILDQVKIDRFVGYLSKFKFFFQQLFAIQFVNFYSLKFIKFYTI